MERLWGSRNLERIFEKPLPAKVKIGESWEISDRPEANSEIANGPLAGRTLRWLMENQGKELLGDFYVKGQRFPLLIKILDASEKLSLQVHPPASKAREMGGEPKTEMWHIVHAQPGAELYVGLKQGCSREQFEAKLSKGEVADCFHRISVQAGDTMFLPSGRVHAIGAGLVLFEVQQNSDTTYRVFDWNRVDANGKQRELHVEASLACIDFNDFEPSVIRVPPKTSSVLVDDPLFRVKLVQGTISQTFNEPGCQIIAMIHGALTIELLEQSITLKPGDFCLVPADLAMFGLRSVEECRFLLIEPGVSNVTGR
jgi:mannose-6-phosphate isomerase